MLLWLWVACQDPLPPPEHSPLRDVPPAWVERGVPPLHTASEATDDRLTLRGDVWTAVVAGLDAAGWVHERELDGQLMLRRSDAPDGPGLAAARVAPDVVSIVVVPGRATPR